MNETRFCGNPDVLMSYLYDEGDEHERRAFESHLRTCERCAREVAGLRSVRGDLAAWTPPEAVLDFRIVRDPAPKRRFAWFAVPELPVWAQFAAATLVVGIAVGISGLEVNYNPTDGLKMRAGWNKPAASAPAQAAPGQAAAAQGSEAPWKADLVALREQLRSELPQPVAASAPAPSDGRVQRAANIPPLSDAAFLAQVRQLIEASETRQQREMALRIQQVVRDMDTQRRADMARVADGIGVLEGRTGAAVAQQREMMNYLMRVSQRQQ
jgi:hypothetical protein